MKLRLLAEALGLTYFAAPAVAQAATVNQSTGGSDAIVRQTFVGAANMASVAQK